MTTQWWFEKAGFKVIHVIENKNQPEMYLVRPNNESEARTYGTACYSAEAWKRMEMAGSAETGGEKAAQKYEGMLPDLRPRYGWMDSVDFDHELGNALGGNVVYPTKENLYENRTCLDTDGECTGIRVVIFSLEAPQLYWQGNAETHLGCGHSKWDSRRDCITCLQFAVDSLNHSLANFHRSSQNQTASGGVEGAHEGTTADESGASPELLPTQLEGNKSCD